MLCAHISQCGSVQRISDYGFVFALLVYGTFLCISCSVASISRDRGSFSSCETITSIVPLCRFLMTDKESKYV